jgi:hypothetical protein
MAQDLPEIIAVIVAANGEQKDTLKNLLENTPNLDHIELFRLQGPVRTKINTPFMFDGGGRQIALSQVANPGTIWRMVKATWQITVIERRMIAGAEWWLVAPNIMMPPIPIE